MPRRLRRIVIAVLSALAFPVALWAQTPEPAQAAKTDSEYLALGRQLTEWFFSAEADSLLAHLSPGARTDAGGVDGVNRAVSDFITRAGVEQELIEEKMTRRRGNPQYWREGRYSEMTGETVVVRWVFDDQGQVIGIGLGPKSRTPAPD